MIMSYTLSFSDSNKTKTVTVPDFPPGLNAVDTSLGFPGRGYPNYGKVVNENFLQLLENFAGPVPPYNPTQGQLWYDNSEGSLKINDGAVWNSITGIYKQTVPPNPSTLKPGDIWVDTSSNLLNIYSNGSWIQVNSTSTNGTYIQEHTFDDANNPNTKHNVLLSWVNGYVIAAESTDAVFTPTTYPSGMQGFTTINPGITLSTNYIIQGTVDNTNKLGTYSADSYLRKDDILVPQIITGKVVYVTPSTQSSSEGVDGLVIKMSGDLASDYVQLYKQQSNAVLINAVQGGKIVLKTKGPSDLVLSDTVLVNSTSVTVNGNIYANNINPAGTLQLFAGSTSTNVPAGWLVCDGSQQSTSTYVSLYNTLGSSYGPVVGNYFYLPNLSVQTPLPVGDPRGSTTSTYYIIKT